MRAEKMRSSVLQTENNAINDVNKELKHDFYGYARKNNLKSIHFFIVQKAVETLTGTECLVLSLFVALVKMGWSGLVAPSGAITDTLGRFSRAPSKSTLGRALRRLEELGYIRRGKFRAREHCSETVVLFLPTLSDFAIHRSKRLTPSNYKYKQPIKYRFQNDINKKQNSCHNKNSAVKKADFTSWQHSILYTLRKLDLGSNHIEILSRAKKELTDRLAASSGVDWKRWDPDGSGRYWRSLSIEEREHIAKTQIARYLALPEQKIEENFTRIIDIVSKPRKNNVVENKRHSEIKLDMEDFKILEDARKKIAEIAYMKEQ